MTEHVILRGANSANLVLGRQKTSRVIHFSDGIARHITLENRYWSVLDRLHTEGTWRKNQLTELALQAAQERPVRAGFTFEDQLCWNIRALIRINMPHVMDASGTWEASNDD